eukprot:jgi/Undpi1/4407/HiC_scaffold_17.g07762.m1
MLLLLGSDIMAMRFGCFSLSARRVTLPPLQLPLLLLLLLSGSAGSAADADGTAAAAASTATATTAATAAVVVSRTTAAARTASATEGTTAGKAATAATATATAATATLVAQETTAPRTPTSTGTGTAAATTAAAGTRGVGAAAAGGGIASSAPSGEVKQGVKEGIARGAGEDSILREMEGWTQEPTGLPSPYGPLGPCESSIETLISPVGRVEIRLAVNYAMLFCAELGSPGLGCQLWVSLKLKGADYPQTGRKAMPSLIGPQRIKYAGRTSTDGEDIYLLQQDHISKHLRAFSVPRNLNWIFSVGEASDLRVFDGLRVLSMLWVVLGHTLAVQSSIGYINPEAVVPPGGLLSSAAGQLFFSARFSVDTFFFVSGFLVVYAMLRRFKHDHNGTKFYVLSPLLMVLYMRRTSLGIAATAAAILASSGAMAVGTYVRGWSALTLDGSWVVKYSQDFLRSYDQARESEQEVFPKLATRWPLFKLADWQRYLVLSSSISIFLFVTFVGYSGYQNPACSIEENPQHDHCGSGWSSSQLALYNAGTRPAWGVALVLLCFVCFNGQFHFSKLDLFMSYVCVAGVTFGSALVMALLVESPLTKLGRNLEKFLRPRERVHKVSSEFFAAEQSPGNIERHVLTRCGSSDDFLAARGRGETDDSFATSSCGPLRALGGVGGGMNGSSRRLSGGGGGGGGAGERSGAGRGELAALVAHTIPGYHDYMTETTAGRRGSEAFG